MIDRLTAAYRPLATQRTKLAVKNLIVDGERSTIDVQNSSVPHDHLEVEAWIATRPDLNDVSFFFEDGPHGEWDYGSAKTVQAEIAEEPTVILDLK